MRSKAPALELAADEEVVAIVRRSWLSQAPRLILIGAWILIPFFFFFPLLAFGPIGLLVFVGCCASGILYALREWHMWYHTMWVVTDRRIIDVDQLSWTAHEVHEITHRKIRKIHLRRDTIGAKVLRFATVWIETKSSHTYDVELEGVRRPKQLKKLLIELRKLSKTT